jgi:hypothetical protein
MISLTPLWHKVLRTVTRKSADIRSMANSAQVLCPEESAWAPAAINLEGDTARVTAVQEDTSREFELLRLLGGKRDHAATTAYQIAGVQFLPSGPYKGIWRYPVERRRDPLLNLPAAERLTEATLCATLYGGIYFGHWMTDDLTLQLAAKTVGNPVTTERRPYTHEPGYRELLRLERQRAVTHARVERLTVIEDFGQNSYKRARYRELRGRAQQSVPAGKGAPVFVRRGSSGAVRGIANSEALEALLLSFGFGLVDPEKMTPAQIAERMLGARMVMGMEGSHLMHFLYTMSDDGVLCVLQPPDRFNNVLKDYTDCLGMQYAFLVCDKTETGFSVDLDRLQQLFEKISVL